MYAVALKERGYQVYVRNSIKSRSGAQIITVNNSTKNRNITQVQVSPGGGRHGESPYVKIKNAVLLEKAAYDVEIGLAKEMGAAELVKKLDELKKKEMGEYYE